MKIGDKVRIKPNVHTDFFNDEKTECLGKILTVEEVNSAHHKGDEVKVEECQWFFWTKELEVINYAK